MARNRKEIQARQRRLKRITRKAIGSLFGRNLFSDLLAEVAELQIQQRLAPPPAPPRIAKKTKEPRAYQVAPGVVYFPPRKSK